MCAYKYKYPCAFGGFCETGILRPNPFVPSDFILKCHRKEVNNDGEKDATKEGEPKNEHENETTIDSNQNETTSGSVIHPIVPVPIKIKIYFNECQRI